MPTNWRTRTGALLSIGMCMTGLVSKWVFPARMLLDGHYPASLARNWALCKLMTGACKVNGKALHACYHRPPHKPPACTFVLSWLIPHRIRDPHPELIAGLPQDGAALRCLRA